MIVRTEDLSKLTGLPLNFEGQWERLGAHIPTAEAYVRSVIGDCCYDFVANGKATRAEYDRVLRAEGLMTVHYALPFMGLQFDDKGGFRTERLTPADIWEDNFYNKYDREGEERVYVNENAESVVLDRQREGTDTTSKRELNREEDEESKQDYRNERDFKGTDDLYHRETQDEKQEEETTSYSEDKFVRNLSDSETTNSGGVSIPGLVDGKRTTSDGRQWGDTKTNTSERGNKGVDRDQTNVDLEVNVRLEEEIDNRTVNEIGRAEERVLESEQATTQREANMERRSDDDRRVETHRSEQLNHLFGDDKQHTHGYPAAKFKLLSPDKIVYYQTMLKDQVLILLGGMRFKLNQISSTQQDDCKPKDVLCELGLFSC